MLLSIGVCGCMLSAGVGSVLRVVCWLLCVVVCRSLCVVCWLLVLD